ncbi:MAG: hypothetical protein K2X68_00375, partial [Novosphingobium sp.]|nr:hypothetical protein [Novosphingobium sp.]
MNDPPQRLGRNQAAICAIAQERMMITNRGMSGPRAGPDIFGGKADGGMVGQGTRAPSADRAAR